MSVSINQKIINMKKLLLLVLLLALIDTDIGVNYSIVPLVAAGLLAGGGAVLGGGLNYLGARGANQTNMQLARQGQEFEQYMWQKNNKYNSPVEQMKRLEDAGLNPNLIYGSGSAATGLSSSYPKPHVATVQNEMQGLGSGISNALAQFMDFQLKKAQIDNLSNNADLTLQKTVNEGIKGRFMEMGIEGKSYENQKMKSLLPYATPAMEANIEKLRLGNRDMLYKIENMNPAQLQNLAMRNKDLNFKINTLNPLTSEGASLRNKLTTQTLSQINPQLMQLRQLENNLKELELGINTNLAPFNLDSKSNAPLKLVTKGLTEIQSLFSKDNFLYNKSGQRYGQKFRGAGGTW